MNSESLKGTSEKLSMPNIKYIRQSSRILSEILQLYLKNPDLKEYLKAVLTILIKTPLLSLEDRGAIFLADPDSETLSLAVSHNFTPKQQKLCTKIPFGKCICGKAALNREIVFVNRVDQRHDRICIGMPPHGHYCIPILAGSKVLGVLDLYVKEGHKRSTEEEIFLDSVSMVLANVIELDRTRRALEESEGVFRTLTTTTSAAIFIYQESRFVYVNKACTEITGYTEKELLSMNFWDVVHPDFRELVRERGMARQKGKRVPSRYEFKIIRKDGQERWIDFTAGRIVWKGRPAGIGTAFDITERKTFEQALRESEERFRSIFENATVGIYRTTPDGRILMANPALVRMLGYSSFEELAQRNLEETGFEPEYPRARFKEQVERDGVVIGLEAAWKRKNGSTIYVRESARAVRDPETGKVLYYEGIVEDITEWKKAEQALEEQLAFLRYVIDSLDHPFYVVNAETYEIEQANKALLQGRTLESGTTCYELTHQREVPCWQEGCACPLKEVIRTKKPVVVEHIHYDASGKEKIVEIHGHPVFDKDGNVTRMIEFTLDITPRKRLEHALSSLAQSYAHLTGKAFLDAITRHIAESMELDIVYVGELLPSQDRIRILSIHGKDAEGWVYDLEDTPCDNVVNKQIVVYPRGVQAEFPKDRVLVEWNVEAYIGTPLFDPDRRPLGIMVGLSHRPFEDPMLLKEYFRVFVDRVTAELLRMKADHALKESEERFKLLAESSLTGIYLIQEGKFTYVNRALADIFGYEVDEIVGKLGPLDLTHPEDRPLVQENIRRRVTGEIESIHYEFRGLRKDGKTIYVEVHGGRIVYQGKPGIIGTLADITERKLAEKEIERSHRLLLTLSQAAQEVQRARTPEEVHRVIGEQIRQLGYDATIFVLNPEETHFTVVYTTLSEDKQRVCEEIFENPVIGYRVPIRPGGIYERILNDSESIFMTIDDSIEARERLTERIQPKVYRMMKELGWDNNIIAPLKTPDMFYGFLAVSGKGLTEADKRGISIFANQAAIALENARLYHETENLALFNKRIVENVADGIIVQDQNGIITFVNPAGARMLGYKPEELIGQHWTDIVPEDQRHVVEAADSRRREGISDRYELELVHRDGKRIIVIVSGSPIVDENGNLTGTMAVFTDITELKKAEQERIKLQQQLFQAQKLEAIGRLAGGVAHDFNNMLTAIIGHAELGLTKIHPDNPVYSDLKEILTAAKRSADLTSKLLGFARKQTVVPRVLDLNETISGMLSMLQRLIGEDIKIVWNPAKDLWKVRIDPVQVNQILANLVVNSKDAEAKTIIIETGNINVDTQLVEKHPYLAEGEYVLLTVSDDGTGMDETVTQHIFEPFFTTKEVGKGTGLGLATVYGIVKQNNGFIHVYSELGKGTTFKIYLPRFIGETEKAGIKTESKPMPGKGETVLLVEDEKLIMDVLKIMLERLGYRVIATNRPTEALELAKAHINEIDVLLTDVVMPEMNGRELAKRLTEINPDIKCIFMSGYTANHIANSGVIDKDVVFVTKPVNMMELAQKIRSVLSKKK